MNISQKITLPLIVLVGGVALASWRFAIASPTIDDFLEVAAGVVMIATAARLWMIRNANHEAGVRGTVRSYGRLQATLLGVGIGAMLGLYWLEIEPYVLLILTLFAAGVLYVVTNPSAPKTWEMGDV
ncbi:MAG: hypothetical protein ACR2RE_25820, partial [Geminicoccaceae bacterium]